jgi:hypothetical protein
MWLYLARITLRVSSWHRCNFKKGKVEDKSLNQLKILVGTLAGYRR